MRYTHVVQQHLDPKALERLARQLMTVPLLGRERSSEEPPRLWIPPPDFYGVPGR